MPDRQVDGRATVCGTLTYYNPGGTPTLTTVGCRAVGRVSRCQDTWGNRNGANQLSISHITTELPFLNGERIVNGYVERRFVSYPIGNGGSAITDPNTIFGGLSNAQLQEDAWEILAKTNPSSSHVNIPAALGELHELPQLVRGWGTSIIKNAAKGNLSWRWGVKPMISDIRKLCKFADAANQRLSQLRKLRDGETIKKRCHLRTGNVATGPTRVLIHSNGAILYAQRQVVSHHNTWGSAEWKLLPGSNLPKLSDADLDRFNKRVALGITTHGALEAAWELVPWSWLIDWFSNVGTMLQATNNSVGCTWGRICVMRTSESRTTYDHDPVGSSTWPVYQGWYNLRFQRKQRWPTSPLIPFPLPSLAVLDAGKWSILLSLAALRR
ncbi:TPA_asm: maturation protein [ssRNA phage SRR7976310_15]|uniref:Maturation protein n=1 Tax=ssRNA phage SRR7976310_15 TaxID=2786677 RepID=A0A8S5L0K5_9VIRU|nr:maturation protein [ssRNA phage SRR7976310_15]DAD51144.1 TPA_asm: maturation protein [ssRNA phage SRR7976310_15]